MTQEEKLNLRNLIRQGDVQSALELLLSINISESRKKEAIAVSARYYKLKQQNRQGILSFEQYNLTENQITAHLIGLINHSDDKPFPKEKSIDANNLFKPSISGVIYYMNSGGKPADGVEVSAFGCGSVYSKNGTFTLNCSGKKAGQKVKLIVGSTDGQGNNIEVVNSRQMEWLRLSDNPNDEPIEIIVCYAGQRDKAALRFYDILVEANTKDYETRLASIEDKLEQTNLATHGQIVLLEQIYELKRQREEVLEKLEEQAHFIANINQDKASDLVKSAIQKIEQQEGINAALTILNDAKLEEAYKLALEKKVKAEVEIKQVVEGYELKIKLLVPWFRYNEATLCYERIINIFENNNFDKEELATLYNKTARVIYDDGKYQKALEYHQKSIEIREEILYPKHPDLATSYNDIALTNRALGKYQKALEYHQKSIEIREEILDPKHPDLATSYNDIALTNRALGKYQKALEYHQKSIEIREEILDPKHPDLATSYNDIVGTFQALGQYEKALEYQRKSIAILEETLDPGHPDLATSYNNIASTYQGLGEFEKALEYYQKSMSILEETLDPRHPHLATLYNNISTTYNALSEYEKALEYHQKSISIQEEILDPGHPDLASSFGNAGNTYYALGQYEKALEYYQKSISIREEILDTAHPYLATLYENAGNTYHALGQYEKALEYYQKSISIREEILDTAHPYLATLYENAGNTYHALGQYEKALEYYQKSISIREEILDTAHPYLATLYENAGNTYHALGQYEKALEYYQKSISIREEILDPGHPDLGIGYWNLAVTYQSMKQFIKAIEMQDICLRILKIAMPENHPFQKNALDTWLGIYYAKAIDTFGKREYAAALQDLEILTKHIDNEEVWDYTGQCHSYLFNYSQAIEAYQKAAGISPEFKTRHFFNNIGIAYAKNKQFEEAYNAFTEYEKLYPNEGRPFRNWAMYYALQGNKGKALQNLKKAIELGYKDLEWFKTDDSMNNLRNEKAYIKIIDKLENRYK